jgi:hypothetical protein
VGATKVGRFLLAVTPTLPPTVTVHDAMVNGQPGLVVMDGRAPVMTMVLEVLDDVIVGVRVVSNPEKLAALDTGKLG